jgi:2,4-dienoyl-CoA reductase (NADPH2)
VKLFEPIRIGAMTVKNRIVMSPMTTGYAGLDQLPTKRLVDYLTARAKGGVGLITLEACVVDRRHREVPQSMHFASDDVIDRHRASSTRPRPRRAGQPQIVPRGTRSPQMERSRASGRR